MKNNDKQLKTEAQYDMAREAGLISPTPPDRKKKGIKINWSRDKSKLKLKKITDAMVGRPKHS